MFNLSRRGKFDLPRRADVWGRGPVYLERAGTGSRCGSSGSKHSQCSGLLQQGPHTSQWRRRGDVRRSSEVCSGAAGAGGRGVVRASGPTSSWYVHFPYLALTPPLGSLSRGSEATVAWKWLRHVLRSAMSRLPALEACTLLCGSPGNSFSKVHETLRGCCRESVLHPTT